MLIGLVGKPNIGKSTFFKAATLAEVEIAGYPFTTIKPNHGFGYVKVECVDKEFNKQCSPKEGYCIEGFRFVPVELMDVAGLVPGAHKGLGMGNEFLDELRQADVLIHVIDLSGSTNEKGEPVDKLSYDPGNDIKFLEVEMDMWYLGIIKKGWEKFARTIQQEKSQVHGALAKQLSGLKVTEEMVEEVVKKIKLDAGKPAEWTEDQLKKIATELRKKTKPIIVAANKIDIPGADENLERLRNEFPDYRIVGCSAESELALREAAKHNLIKYIPGNKDFSIVGQVNDKQKTGLEFIKANVLDKYGSTGVQEVLDTAVFDFLNYIAVFPVTGAKLEDSKGNILPDCHLVPAGITAQEFAFVLHTDFGKNFIKAVDIKTKMTIGKEHVLKHRDIIEIISGK
jgi:ribosome-binding ATPase YchF (GTP1/OBG family)